MSALNINSTITLRNGSKLPVLGFGVYQSYVAAQSSKTALEQGYIHIDSARAYKNEAEVLDSVKKYKEAGGTSEIWLTTKVTGKEHPTEKCIAAVDDSVKKATDAGLSWDLFLLHDPTAGPEKRLQAWRVLEAKKDAGVLKTIGVSNFSDVHLEELKKAGVKYRPEINQIELHPWCQQKPIVEYCKKEGIVLQAYCPIVRGQRFTDPVLLSISNKINKTPAQVLIRWSLQKGYVPLPKSDTAERIAENAKVFGWELSEEDMSSLDALDEGAKGACSWNPVGHV
ncbi:Aldo/keto reductase [Meredithblackwellia eburnea MCA 4105]